MAFVKSIDCSGCDRKYAPAKPLGLCECGAPLLVRYDLAAIRKQLKKTALVDRPSDMWRYIEVMPVEREDDIVTLGEGFSPILHLKRYGAKLGLPNLWLKDESLNPTGSFKARGLSAAVSMAKSLGIEKVSIPSAGNAAGALAAYCAKAGIAAYIFMPRDTPAANIAEVRACGAELTLVDGVITDAARAMDERGAKEGWYDVSTLKEPYRIEGKKTMGYELAEQYQWDLPDVIVYPTGGGTGLIGMWKAFAEMEELGWIGSKRPRMVTVQAEGCAPIVRAFERGQQTAEPWENPSTIASGLRVPRAVGDALMLRTLRESQGTAVAVSDDHIVDSVFELGRLEGIFAAPEGAACLAALRKLLAAKWLEPTARILVFNTGAGNKYVDVLRGYIAARRGTRVAQQR